MPEEERRYSLISLDKASDEEPVIRVDERGVHTPSPNLDVPDAASSPEGAAQGAVEGLPSAQPAPDKAPQDRFAEQRAEIKAEEDSLEGGTVPLAGAQKLIVAALIIGLLVFIAYFLVTKG